MKQLRIHTAAIFILLASAIVSAQAKGYKVVVNSSNPLVSITRENLSRIFLKKTTKFPNGLNASPVDLSVSSTVRRSFSKDVLGKPSSAVDAYWQQLIFSGRDVPPPQKTESGVLEFVRSNGSGVAYIPEDADTTGVKVIIVTEY